MRRLSLAALLAAVIPIVTGCGHPAASSSRATTPVTPAFVCHPAPEPTAAHPFPGQLGECLRQKLRAEHQLSSTPTLVSGGQGLDVANYQGYVDLARAKAAGLRFLIGQSNDGASFTDYNFVANWARARALGIPHGAYVFARPGCASCQAALMASQIRRAGGMDAKALPPAIDAEVPGAYCNVPAIAYWLRVDLHISHVLTYTSPGLWSCGFANGGTLLWVAIWGSPGYSFDAWHGFVAQQYCGLHCYFPGVSGEVDRDVDHGLLSLLVPPETPSQIRARKHRELAAHERVLRELRVQIVHLRIKQEVHGCTTRRHRHERIGPKCRSWFAAGDRVHAHGRYEDRVIAKFHREGIRR